MRDLRGKTCVVTGAANGIGRACVRRFAREGMRVVAGDIDEPRLDALVGEIEADGGAIATLRVDTSELGDVESLRDLALETFGSIDLVMNNAGVAGPNARSPHELSQQDYEWVIGVDLFGVIHGVRTFLPPMIEQDSGHMVNTASLSGLTSGAAINAAYYAAKHGVVGLTEAVFHDLRVRGSGVGVSCLCPGFVDTSIFQDAGRRPERLVTPDRPDPTEEQERIEAAMRELLASGHSPEHVAELVRDAVLERRFYIFTQMDAMPAIAARHRAIEQGGLPPVGRMDAGLLGDGSGA